MPFDLLGCGLGFGIVPRRAQILFAVHVEVVVAGRALPRTDGMSFAWFEIFLFDGVRGEILVAFHLDAVIGFSENSAFPYCFCHITSLDFLYG